MNNLIIQTIGFVGTIVYLFSYQFRSNRTLFRIQCFADLCYTVHFILLGAYTGAISYFINIIRSVCLGSNKHFLNAKTTCIILCLLQALVLPFTYYAWISILPVVANIASTIAGFTNRPKIIRWTGILVNSPIWICYDAIVGSWAGIFDEILSILSIFVSLILLKKQNHCNKTFE